MGYTKREIQELQNIEVEYERVGMVYDHIETKQHKCFTCDRPSVSEFCSTECFEMRFF
jgi:hypothetical protein